MMGFRIGCGVGIVVLLSACGRASYDKGAAAPPSAPSHFAASSASVEAAQEETTRYESKGSSEAAPSAATPAPGLPAPPPPTPEGAVDASGAAQAKEMLDIEAHLGMLVSSMSAAREQLRQEAAARGATVTNDVVQDSGGMPEASLTIRVPKGLSNAFLADVERLGEVTSRQISAKDIGREFHDSEIVLHNLERTLARYEEILAKAQTVEEILKIEGELSRIRGEIDRVKGDLRYLGDRAARATVFVILHERAKEIAVEPEREAKFYPGVRAVMLNELRSNESTLTSLGAGLVVGAGRPFNAELDLMKGTHSDANGLDAVLATVGGDAYSDFLGGGERRYLNPYLGLRVGYARLRGQNEFAIGGTLGLELLKTQYSTIDLDLRALGLFGKQGSELGLEPSLGANVAF